MRVFVMSSVMWDAPELAERYDKVSDLQFESGRRLADMMGIKEGDRVLDVGCGTGRLALHISKVVGPSGSVIGIDPSPHRIRVAEAKLKGPEHGNMSFMLGQGEDLISLPSGTFDHVYYSSVFHWIGDKAAALAEAMRILKPGGAIGMTTVDRSHPLEMKKVMERLFSQPPYVGHVKLEDEFSLLVDREELNALLANAGFGHIDIKSVVKKHYYSSAEELFEFIEASSFGNFLRDVPEHLRQELLVTLKGELEKRRAGASIELESSMMYAIARKPDST
jgi:ubiquinone/menaquinone biosynthesis C-methylase UbiE